MEETARIPKSKTKLQRPVDERHALARIEEGDVWITSRNRQLAELFSTLICADAPLTKPKSSGVVVWGPYSGTQRKTGTVVLDRKPDGRFKLVALDMTPDSLLEEVSGFVGRDASVKSEEGRHGLVFRGMLREAHERVAPEALETNEPQPLEPAAIAETATAGAEFERVTGSAAIEIIKQKVALEYLESGVKVRIRGKQKDCEAVAKAVLKGSPTVASQQGAKFMIEGNLSKSFLRKGANQEGPDANGVTTRTDSSERTFTAFGENLTAVQAACLAGCKADSMFTMVVNDRSSGYVVVSSGKRKAF